MKGEVLNLLPCLLFVISPRDSHAHLPKARRSLTPLRRNQSERSYTQSIWLSDPPADETKKTEESTPSEPSPRKPPAPFFRRSSERAGIGRALASNGHHDGTQSENQDTHPQVEQTKSTPVPSIPSCLSYFLISLLRPERDVGSSIER